jgi:hypothetical protein
MPNTNLPNAGSAKPSPRGWRRPRPRRGAQAARLPALRGGRLAECEAEFRLARQSDRNFALDKSEAGHPVWGPVYKKLQP